MKTVILLASLAGLMTLASCSQIEKATEKWKTPETNSSAGVSATTTSSTSTETKKEEKTTVKKTKKKKKTTTTEKAK